MNEQFKKVEDDYFVLRGKLESHVITREQFEAALKDMMIQDAQRHWWMLGVNDAKWYMNDGKSWIQAEPPQSTKTSAPSDISQQSKPSRFSKKTIIAVILLAIGLCSCLNFFATLIALSNLTSSSQQTIYLGGAIAFLIVAAACFVFARITYRRK